MYENEYKKKLREEIGYYKTHTLEEILLDKYNIDMKEYISLYDATYVSENNQKNLYDSLQDSEIDDYINKVWLMKESKSKISEKTSENKEVKLAVQIVENFGLEDENQKKSIQNEIKKTISLYGTGALSLSCITAIISLIMQDPKIIQQGLAISSVLFPLMCGFSLLKNGTIKEIKNKDKAIEILKMAGIYEILIDKMKINEELESIETKSRGK